MRQAPYSNVAQVGLDCQCLRVKGVADAAHVHNSRFTQTSATSWPCRFRSSQLREEAFKSRHQATFITKLRQPGPISSGRLPQTNGFLTST